MSKIFIYPALTDVSQLESIVSRLSWYFKPYLDKIKTIYCISTGAKVGSVRLAPNLDPMVEQYIPELFKKINFVKLISFDDEIEKIDLENDLLLIWDESAEKTASAAVKAAIKGLGPKLGLYRVDPKRTRMEGSFYLWAGMNKYADQKSWTAQNHDRMRRMVSEIGQHEKAYVFGSGPSLSDFVNKHDFSDGICIISNSIVKNRDIIACTRPKIIAAADPLYHAGCSSYAGAFRSELIDALRLTGAWFVCPLRDFAIYDAFLPADLRERIIGIPFKKNIPSPVDLCETFHLHPYPNVLTLALLPLAASVAKKIEIIGCDGRELIDDSFFWSHDAKAQFNDKMAEIQAVHPAFFAINYNDYYIDHCRDVERVLTRMETAGKTLVTRTVSMIPALRDRQVKLSKDNNSNKSKAAAFVMIDPDAKDDWGHFLAYDKRIAEGCEKLAVDFVLLCRKGLDPKFFPAHASLVIPTFTIHSWSVGNKWPNMSSSDVMLFSKELDEAFSRIEKRYPDGEICIFMYIGSIEVAEVVEHLLVNRPRLRAVINLFWSYNFDHNDAIYKDFWLRTVQRLERSEQVFLMHSTDQIADEFREDWSVDLPVLPHPSTTFGDKAVLNLSDLPEAQPKKLLQVLFPGGTRREKGFLLSTGACALLADERDLKQVLRARIDKASGNDLEAALRELAEKIGNKIDILDEDLSDDEFIDMIRTADIVVIPYLTEAFRRRTSGILVDAFLLGKPVVVLKNTWLSDIVEPGGIGICADADPASLAEAIRQVAARYPEFLKGIAKVRSEYLQNNSWVTLAANVLEYANFAVSRKHSAFKATQVDLLALTAELLLQPKETLSRILPDAKILARIEGELAAPKTEDRLKSHYASCLAYAQNFLKV